MMALGFWNTHWHKGSGRDDMLGVLGGLRAQALEEAKELTPHTEDSISRAVSRLARKPTRWADGWTNSELKHVLQNSPEARKVLPDVYNSAEREAVLPAQATYVIVGLAPKPGITPSIEKGKRPICIFSSFYQLWGLLRGDLNGQWEASKAGHWDTAIKGSSALLTGLMRALLDEAAAINNIVAVSAYFDMAKLYDSISLSKLCTFALKLKYPALPLSFSIQAYLGGRRLRADGCVSEETKPWRSLVAGCKRANIYARIILYDLMDHLARKLPMVTAFQFVDDLVQRAEGTVASVAIFLPEAVSAIMRGAEQLELVVSQTKTKIAGHALGAKAVCLQLQAMDVHIDVADEVKDLGIGQSWRTRRVVKQQYKRLKLGLSRVNKVKKLKFTRQAKKLINTGVMPAACYGAPAGWPPRQVAQARSAMARVLPGGKLSACITTTIRLSSKKPFDDPGVKMPVTTILTWIDLWYKLVEGRRSPIRIAWGKVLRDMVERLPTQRWAKVTGPISATIVSLQEMGWHPALPDVWVDEMGDSWQLTAGVSSSDIKHKLTEAITKQYWRKAATFHLGDGLQEGPDLTEWTRQYNQRITENKLDEAGMQATIGSGGFWSPARRLKSALATAGCFF